MTREVALPSLYGLLNPSQSVASTTASAAALPAPVAGLLPQATTGGTP